MVYYTSIAKKRPLGTQTQARLTKKNKIILHTMVGSLWGTDSYFMQGGYSGTESHFGVGYDGETLQWQDDDYRADANLEGNDDCISIETADRGPGFPDWNTSGDNVPPWTARQIEAIAQIIAAVAKRHNIPLVLIKDTEDSTRGIGYHRQGVDPYRTHGEKYSNAYGKVCPGNKRVAQIPQVIARAKQIMAGGAGGGSGEEELDMDQATFQQWVANGVHLAVSKSDAVRNEIAEIVEAMLQKERGPYGGSSKNMVKLADGGANRYAYRGYTETPRRVWETPVRRAVNGETKEIPALQELADTKTTVLELKANLAALANVVAQLASGENLTADEIKAAAKAGADEALNERITGAEVHLEVAPADE